MELEFDNVVIGAGAAGLLAAWELSLAGRSVAVLEARDRIGGRAHTVTTEGFDMPAEMGAEFVHGNLEATLSLLDKAGIKYYKAGGEFWQKEGNEFQKQGEDVDHFSFINKKLKNIQNDISIEEFVRQYLSGPEEQDMAESLKRYVEGYYAGDTGDASTLTMRKEMTEADEVQYRIEGGYVELMQWLYSQCTERAVRFYLSTPVESIDWSSETVQIKSSGIFITCRQCLCTVPVGVLKRGDIHFLPAIHNNLQAVQKLGFGSVIKILLQFDTPFWKEEKFAGKDLSKMSFVFSDGQIPTFWTYYPKTSAMLAGWCAGPRATALANTSDEELSTMAVESLASLFDMSVTQIRNRLTKVLVGNWPAEQYTMGGYSYDVVGGDEYKKSAQQPLDRKLYFAGEGYFIGIESGTVNAAIRCGREVAHRMISEFKK